MEGPGAEVGVQQQEVSPQTVACPLEPKKSASRRLDSNSLMGSTAVSHSNSQVPSVATNKRKAFPAPHAANGGCFSAFWTHPPPIAPGPLLRTCIGEAAPGELKVGILPPSKSPNLHPGGAAVFRPTVGLVGALGVMRLPELNFFSFLVCDQPFI